MVHLQMTLCLSFVALTVQFAPRPVTCYWAKESGRADQLVDAEDHMEECREQCFSDMKCRHAEGDFCKCGPDLLPEPGGDPLGKAATDLVLLSDTAVEFSARLMTSSQDCLDSVTDKSGYNVAIIFAGRRSIMHVLVPYLERLVKQCSLQEVHMWDYARTVNDSNWLQEVAKTHSSWQVLHAFKGQNWVDCYAYYSSTEKYKFAPRSPAATPQNTVLIKLDDDIVHIDTSRFDDYTSYIRNHREKFLVHANIVNNGVAAYYQTKNVYGMAKRFPLISNEYPSQGGSLGLAGSLFDPGPLPTELHKFSLQYRSNFTWSDDEDGGCIVFGKQESARAGKKGQGRISINFMGARWEEWGKLNELVATHLDDEYAASVAATEQGMEECLFTGLSVAHFSYANQQVPWEVLTEGYEQLLETERMRWAGSSESAPV